MEIAELWDDFRTEVDEHLQALDAALLKLERQPSAPEPLRQMFLSAHTIKGDAAMIGLEQVRDLAHAMEDVLVVLRDGQRPLSRDVADLLFRAVDGLRQLVALGPMAPEDAGAAVQIGVLRTCAQQLAAPA